jgi:hypothetical protein
VRSLAACAHAQPRLCPVAHACGAHVAPAAAGHALLPLDKHLPNVVAVFGRIAMIGLAYVGARRRTRSLAPGTRLTLPRRRAPQCCA